ncbi:MAG: ABC transporter ATP-binding protein [Ruminococcus sp.]|jgi:NitT/TauT family transport system ATP-binding protein
MKKPLLELKDVSLSYHTPEGETAAISHISFQVPKSGFVALVGPSGCGKSTILNLICGLLKPEEGEILMNGTSLPEKPSNIGYMLQKDHLFEWRTVYSNILLGLETQKKVTPEKKAYIDRLMVTYGLDAFKQARPSQLSGGMRQRAALIRTLALEPDLLLLDEPFSALDYQTRLNVSDDIGKIIKQEKKTAVLVTHDISEAISMADTVIVLTSRPATVKKSIPIDLEIPDRTPLASRNALLFKTYFNQIWRELNGHE